MPEEIAATPGWTDERLDRAFAALPANPEVAQARNAYEACLAARKAPATPSDMLGAEFQACRPALHQALRHAGIEDGVMDDLNLALEAVEAEIAEGS